jgi:hypothetical protein
MVDSFTMGWDEWRGYGPAETLGLTGAIDMIINAEKSFEDALNKTTSDINKVLKRYYP